MKFLFTFLGIFILNVTHSQNILAEYDIFYNTDHPMRRGSVLYYDYNSQTSIFRENYKNLPWDIKENEHDADFIATVAKNLDNEFVLFDFKKRECFLIEDFVKSTYKVEEIFPVFDWQITSDEKQIGNLNCKKAIGNYRSRKFEVWFAAEIPIQVGPWKFNGLPGLVIEAYSLEMRYHYVLRNIKYNEDVNIELPQIDKLVSIRDYVTLQNEFHENSTKAATPRGATVTVIKADRANFLEPKYEWEE
ncbi:GLPGLI family protein [Paenimyroides tangerinum]|uniref:GLPGLI family protein n=1 Tax=Paenimyroides tangerinum TaxID=2488728 RepID=A0A3P3W5D3_9FLAO|nr:GLPGLI family protein [Paenimyroides tangerinum]RRJ90341.1 GLPGLI family protein [Paenimyroides tangerinum]